LVSFNKIDVDNKKALVNCVKDLYRMGFTSPVSGNHSMKIENTNWMWITPSGVLRYNLREEDLVKVNLKTGISLGKLKPSIEWYMHLSIYKKSKVNAIVHTHSPYTLGIAISLTNQFQHVLEEAKIIVGDPVIVSNKPSGSKELADIVSEAFGHTDAKKLRAVIIKNHGVVAIGNNIHEARAVVEALEEWAKILTITKIFGGPRDVLDSSAF
jgi:L-ribulose-5-phosphate 4-epimerase